MIQLIKDQLTAAGTDTYTSALVTKYTSLQKGIYVVTFTNANTGAATLNVDGLSAMPIVNSTGSAITAGFIGAGNTLLLIFDGTSFIVSGSVSTSGFELIANKAIDFSTLNNTLYPSVQAVNSRILSLISGLAPYFYYKTVSDIGGAYYEMKGIPSTGGAQTIVSAGVTNAQVLATFVTVAGVPGVTSIATGVIKFNSHATQTAGTKTTQLYAEVYKRNLAGTETLLATSAYSSVIGGVDADYNFDASIGALVTLLTTDRIVTKIIALVSGSGSAPNITITVEDNTAARTEMPFAPVSAQGSTGIGSLVYNTSPTLVTPALGTPSALVGTNITGTAAGLTAGTVTTNANLTGAITSVGNATSLGSFTSLQLKTALTDETGSGSAVFATSPTLVTPALGTPSALVGTNITGTAAGLTAGTVTTNANLTGAITSVGNATSLGSFTSAQLASALTDETGSGVAVFNNNPTLIAPVLGDASATTLLMAGDPTLALQVATKAYVDNLITGLMWKSAVNCATTANITLSGEQTIDGFTTSASRVLVKNQSTASQNGIYLTSAGAWTRTTDADTGAEIQYAALLVDAGSTYAATQWTCTNSTLPVIGVTSITWGQVAGAGTYTAGTGITVSSNVFSIDSTVVTLTGSQVLTNKTLTTPNLGTPSTLVGTNITGTAAGLTAGTVTTNANLTGAITSVGNATSLGSFSSANLAAALTDETGSGAAVFGTSPTIAGGTHTGITSFGIKSTAAAFDMKIANVTAMTADRTLTLDLGDANRTVAFLSGTVTFNNSFTSGTSPTTLTTTNTTNVTLPTSGTLYGTAAGSITSLQLKTSLSDETGSGSAVFAISPSLSTSIISGTSTMDVFQTSATTINAFGDATTINVGGTPTSAITHSYSSNATLTGTTKTVNIGTGGASGSTTNVNIGSSVSGALGTTTFGGNTLSASTTSLTMFNSGTTTLSAYAAVTSATILATTAAATINFASGATLTATTKTLNLGAGGVSGSTTTIAIGSTTSGALGSTTFGGTTLASSASSLVFFNTTTTTVSMFQLASQVDFSNLTTTQTMNLACGITATGNAKNISIGTSGAAGSTTTIIIGNSTPSITAGIYLNGDIVHLSGKTSTFTGHNINVGSDASYDMWHRGTGAGLTRIANGTTGQVLTSTAGAAPAYSSAPVLTNPSISAIKGTLTLDSDSATITFDKNVSDFHNVIMAGNRTLALSNMAAGDRICLRLMQDATGSRIPTWFTSIKWAGGVAPTLTTTANKADVFSFLCTSASNYDGFVIGQNI